MLYTIIAFLSLAAIMGMVLLSYVLRTKPTPKGIMPLHGLFAATGLILLISYTFGHKPRPLESAILFTIAALGGIMVAVRDLTNKPIPKWLAVVHGLVAVTGFIFLLVFTFGR